MGNTHTVAMGVERHASYLGTVIRSKGFIWLGSCKDTKVLWNQAGKVCNLTHVGPWRNAEEDWILSFIGYNDSMKEIDERRQELVLLGLVWTRRALWLRLTHVSYHGQRTTSSSSQRYRKRTAKKKC